MVEISIHGGECFFNTKTNDFLRKDYFYDKQRNDNE